MLGEAEPRSGFGERFLAHQAGAQAGQLAFGEMREAGVQLVGDLDATLSRRANWLRGRVKHLWQLSDVDQVTAQTPCGPDIVDEVTKTVRQYLDAGYDHLYFHQIGPDQDGFLRYWERDLAAALR